MKKSVEECQVLVFSVIGITVYLLVLLFGILSTDNPTKSEVMKKITEKGDLYQNLPLQP
jgi:hypothetical protein